MKNLLVIITIICLAVTAISCGKGKAKGGTGAYSLTCTVDADLMVDSATLYIVEDNYQCLTPGMTRIVKSHGKPFNWNGHIDGAKAAFIKLDSDTALFYLVLGPGNTTIDIHRGDWTANGTSYNNEYIAFLNHRFSIIANKKGLFRQYMQASNDSTLTAEVERDFMARDSVLSDSLQRYMTWRMSTGDPVSLIVKERFFKELTLENQRKL